MVKTHGWRELRVKKVSPDRLKEIDEAVAREVLEMDLAELRRELGMTQDELAKKISVTQPELSRMENREDHRLSTLRRYVEALGGHLEVSAVFKKKKIRLAG